MCAKATKEQDKEGFLFTSPPRPNVKTCGVVPLLSAKPSPLPFLLLFSLARHTRLEISAEVPKTVVGGIFGRGRRCRLHN